MGTVHLLLTLFSTKYRLVGEKAINNFGNGIENIFQY